MKAVKYAAMAGPIAELRARLEKEKENVAEVARKKAEAAAREQFDGAWAAFDEKVLAGDIAGAKAALASAKADEVLKPVAATIEKWEGLIKGFEEVAAAEKKAREDLTSLVGKDVVLETTKGKHKGKVKSVSGGVILLEHKFSINRQVGYAEIKVKVENLTEKEKRRLMPAPDPKTPDGWLARAAAAMGSKDVAAADTALAKAAGHPLAAHYREKLEVMKLGEAEVAARKAWEAVETLVKDVKEWNKATGEKILERLKAFETEHAASELGKEKADELAALIQRAEDAAVGFNIRKAFKGTVESFDKDTREIVLSYGFDEEDELEDWEGGPDVAVIKDGKILSSDGTRGFTRMLRATFEGDLTMETVSVTRLGHGGKWWIAYRPAGDKGKGGRAGTDFRSVFGPEPGYKKGAEEKIDFKFESATTFYRSELKYEGNTIHYSVDGKRVKSFSPLSFPAERVEQRPGYNVGGYGFGGIDSFRVRGRLSKAWLDRKIGDFRAQSGAGPVSGGAGADAVRKLYRGEVAGFDPKTMEIELAYDFENPDQVKDFFFGLGRRGKPTRGSVKVDKGMLHPGKGYGFALLKGVFLSVSVTVDYIVLEGDRGGCLHVCDSAKGGDNYYLACRENARLGKHVEGTHKYLSTVDLPEAVATARRGTMKFSRVGSLVKGQIGGVVVEAKDMSHSSGHVGLGMAGGHAEVAYDNLRVTGVLDRVWLEAQTGGKKAGSGNTVDRK
jgi:hypothetical protein